MDLSRNPLTKNAWRRDERDPVTHAHIRGLKGAKTYRPSYSTPIDVM